jgi:hypothetical protein
VVSIKKWMEMSAVLRGLGACWLVAKSPRILGHEVVENLDRSWGRLDGTPGRTLS